MSESKFHWGYGLAAAMALFIGLMVYFFVHFAAQREGLTAENPYEKGLAYDQTQAAQAAAANAAPALTTDGDYLTLRFDSTAKDLKGEIHFYRPSDADSDVKLPLALTAKGEQKIPVALLKKGRWRAKISWTNAEGKAFYDEKELTL